MIMKGKKGLIVGVEMCAYPHSLYPENKCKR